MYHVKTLKYCMIASTHGPNSYKIPLPNIGASNLQSENYHYIHSKKKRAIANVKFI